MYEYRARVLEITDGDTIELDVDLGMSIHVHERCRLYGINAPETHGVKKDSEEYKRGMAATEFLRNMIEGKEVLIRTFKDKKEKYGRYLVEVFECIEFNEKLVPIPPSVNAEMVEAGHAVPYFGRNDKQHFRSDTECGRGERVAGVPHEPSITEMERSRGLFTVRRNWIERQKQGRDRHGKSKSGGDDHEDGLTQKQ